MDTLPVLEEQHTLPGQPHDRISPEIAPALVGHRIGPETSLPASHAAGTTTTWKTITQNSTTTGGAQRLALDTSLPVSKPWNFPHYHKTHLQWTQSQCWKSNTCHCDNHDMPQYCWNDHHHPPVGYRLVPDILCQQTTYLFCTIAINMDNKYIGH